MLERLRAHLESNAEPAARYFFYGALLDDAGVPAPLADGLRAAGATDMRVDGDPLGWLDGELRPALSAPPRTDTHPGPTAVVLTGVPEDRYFHDRLAALHASVREGDVALCLGIFEAEFPGQGYDAHPPLEYFLRGAERAGFEVWLEQDLTPPAVRWVEAIGRLVPAGERSCARLLDSLRRGTHACRLVGLRATRAPVFRSEALAERHHEDVSALFRRVFSAEFPPQRWPWKYGGGRGQGVLAWRGGELAGFYGGVTRPIRYFGRDDFAVQICDVMVDSGVRGVLTRRGAMFVCASTFLEQYIGYGARHLLGFGFPTERHMLLAERQGLYDEVGRMVEVSWTALAAPPRFSRLAQIAPDQPGAAAAVDGLWEAMAADMRGLVVGVRDWSYLCHRYFDHPERSYRVHLVRGRLSGRPRAALVTRIDAGRCELLDCIGPFAALRSAIHWARYLAGQGGAGNAYAWVSRAQQARVCGRDGLVSPLDIRNPTSVWSKGPPATDIADKWWFTGGDTDFR